MPEQPTRRNPRISGKVRDDVMAFVSSDTQLAVVRQYCQRQGIVAATFQQGTIRDAVAYLKENRTPKVLLVELPDKTTALDDIDQLAEVCEPDVKVITTGTINELSFYRELIDVGINDYLLQPFSDEEFARVYERLSKGTASEESGERANTHIAVLGTRGGIGVTTIVNTLAYIFAEDMQIPTCVLDLDPHYGTASLDLDLDPSRGYREALEKPDKIDSLFMDRILIKYSDSLSMLSAEEGIEDDVHPSDKTPELLVKELEARSQILITDVPRMARKYIWNIVAKADVILIVTDLSVSGLRDTSRYLELISGKMAKGDIRIIANLTGVAGKREIPGDDFEDNVKRKISLKIPFESDIAAFQNTGKPLAEFNASSKTLKLLRELAHDLSGQQKASPKLGEKRTAQSTHSLLDTLTGYVRKKK